MVSQGFRAVRGDLSGTLALVYQPSGSEYWKRLEEHSSTEWDERLKSRQENGQIGSHIPGAELMHRVV